MEGRKEKKGKSQCSSDLEFGGRGKVFGHVTASREGNLDILLLPGQKAVLLIPQREFLAPPEFQGTGQGKAAVKIRAALSKETLCHASAHLLGK